MLKIYLGLGLEEGFVGEKGLIDRTDWKFSFGRRYWELTSISQVIFFKKQTHEKYDLGFGIGFPSRKPISIINKQLLCIHKINVLLVILSKILFAFGLDD